MEATALQHQRLVSGEILNRLPVGTAKEFVVQIFHAARFFIRQRSKFLLTSAV